MRGLQYRVQSHFAAAEEKENQWQWPKPSAGIKGSKQMIGDDPPNTHRLPTMHSAIPGNKTSHQHPHFPQCQERREEEEERRQEDERTGDEKMRGRGGKERR